MVPSENSEVFDYDPSRLCPSIRSDMIDDPNDQQTFPEFNFDYMEKHCIEAKSYRCSIRYMRVRPKYGEMQGSHESSGALNRHHTPQLESLVLSVSNAITDPKLSYGCGAKNRYAYHDMYFEPRGCIWNTTVVPQHPTDSKAAKPDKQLRRVSFVPQKATTSPFRIRIVASAIPEEGTSPEDPDIVGYCVDVMFLPISHRKFDTSAATEELLLAKSLFTMVGYDVKKAVVKCEIPELPEGCKVVSFRKVYQINVRLKSGAFATVCRGTHRETGKKVAIKCVRRKDIKPSDDVAVYDEVSILASLQNPHIVPLIDFFEGKGCYYIIMELMAGGDLFDRISLRTSYSEKDARDLFRKLLDALKYCHDLGVCHRDLKPKNLLLKSDDNDSYIKLGDFGLAVRVHQPKSLTKQCGTPFFVAPEVLQRKKYDEQSDMWGCGCILFVLLSGNLPFNGKNQKDLFRKIVAGKYEMVESDWEGVSEEAKDLVRGLLVTDPDKRMTAADAIRSKWIRESSKRLLMHDLALTTERLKSFNARLKFRSAFIAVGWINKMSNF